MSNVNVDMIANGQTQGQVAASVGAGGRLDPGKYRPFIGPDGRAYMTVYTGGNPKKKESFKTIQVNAATLRRDEWKSLDEAVRDVARERLGGVQDLIDKGLVYQLGNALGTTVLEWHDVSEALEAGLSMDGVTRQQGDRPEYGTNYLPMPIIHADYEINSRVLESSRSLGNPIDTTMAERAARRVNEFLEKMLFTDVTFKFGGGTIYSYLNYEHRNKVNLTQNWDDNDKGGDDILKDCLALKQESIDNYHYGPWQLYIPTAYETVLDGDYDKTTPGTSVRERVLKISGIEDVKVIDTLPANNILLVQMTSNVVRLVQGMGIQNVEWQSEGNFVNNYKVMTIQVPQIRSDHNNKTGIVHMAGGLV